MEAIAKIKVILFRVATTKMVRAAIAGLVILGLFFLLFRACSSSGAKNSTFRIARASTWPALDLMGKEPNLLAFLDDLIAEIAQNEKISIRMTTLNQGDLMGALDKGIYDGVLMVLTPDPLLHEYYDISNPVFKTGPVLVVNTTSQVVSLKDLGKANIGIKNGSPFLFKLTQNPNLTFVPYDNMFTALEDLVKGSLSGVIMEAQIAKNYIYSFYKDKLKITGPPLIDVSMRLVAHWDAKGESLIEHFNKGLEKTHQNGVFDSLAKKWAISK